MKPFIFLFILFTQVVAASVLEEKLLAAYKAREAQGDVKGMAIGVITPEESLKLKFGEAKDSQKGFEIGSVSKTFTGLALGVLASQQKLDLSAPVSTYIPELADSYVGSLTTEQVAIHEGKLIRNLDTESTEGKLIAFLREYKPEENFPEYQYSNVGYALLTLIIERVSHQSFEDFVKKEIFLPLNMQNSGMLTHPDVANLLLNPHSVINEITIYDIRNDLSLGSGGIYSTLEDMFQFLKLNMFPDECPTLAEGVRLSQSRRLGWDHKPGQKTLWKNGMMSGFTSFFELYPAKKSGTIVLNNSNYYRPTEDMGGLALGFEIPFVPEVAPTKEFKDIYLGRYTDEAGQFELDIIELEKGNLAMKVRNKLKSYTYDVRLESQDGKSFKLSNGMMTYEDVVFITDEATGRKILRIKTSPEDEIYYK